MTSPFLNAIQPKPKGSPVAVKEDKSVFAPSVMDASPMYAPAVKNPVPQLQPLSPEEIQKVGSDAGLTLRSLNSEVLKHQRGSDGDEMSQRLTAIIKEAKQLDPSSIEQSKGFGKLVKKFLGMKEDLFGQYDTVNNRIEELVKSLKDDLRKEQDSLHYLQKLEEAVAKYALSLNRDIEILAANYSQIENYFNSLADDEVEERQRQRDTMDLLEIRIADLKALRLLCLQMGPRVQSMQKVSSTLVRTGNNIIDHVIPAYTANFSAYITSLRQKKVAESQNRVIDEFNTAIRMGSELAGQNQIAATQLANRQVLDIETLRKDQENLVKMIEETNRINTEARASRIEYINEVQSLEDGMVEKIKSGLL